MCLTENEILVFLYSSFPFLCSETVWKNNTEKVFHPAIFLKISSGRLYLNSKAGLLKMSVSSVCKVRFTSISILILKKRNKINIVFIAYCNTKCSEWEVGETRTHTMVSERRKFLSFWGNQLIHFCLKQDIPEFNQWYKIWHCHLIKKVTRSSLVNGYLDALLSHCLWGEQHRLDNKVTEIILVQIL